ncbi:MAG: VanZ family protein [Enterococcus viikkiensis]|uniref:VanZ family protein n=1 Tax=Enterococcus viikkiensis TaxID=930854 RepID=A0ABU3FRP1_9ENTE|nr:VanZ family protein [Enterococcus viikkiensis]MDT2828308.1 VanZ family protein [Enterococcus viikkiensis]
MQKQLKNGNVYLGIAGLMMVVLFISSSMTYQQQSQVSVIQKYLANEPLKQFFSSISFNYAGSEVSIAAKGYVKFVEFFIRKAAHFTTYFILGGSLYLGLLPKLKQKSLVLGLVFAWLAATGYAATDEFHQMLTGGRTPLFQDVMLDSSGALTACLLIMFIHMLRRKR